MASAQHVLRGNTVVPLNRQHVPSVILALIPKMVHNVLFAYQAPIMWKQWEEEANVCHAQKDIIPQA